MIRMLTNRSMVGLSLAITLAACEIHGQLGSRPAAAPPHPPPGSAPAAPGAAAPAPATQAPAPNPTKMTRPRAIGRVMITPGGLAAARPTVPAPTGTPTIQSPNAFGSADAKADSWRGVVYFIPEGTQKFPDVGALKPALQLYTSELNITPRSFKEGFPGVDNRFDWFAIRYEGPLTVATEGDYEFRLNSDDGALFYIDDTLIIDNDGAHGPTDKRQFVHLITGPHVIRVDYFQGARFDVALQLFVTAPNDPSKKEKVCGPNL